VSDRNGFVSSRTLSQIAGLYAAAFENGIQVLPYGADK
jgi:hypothetical protein